VDCGWTVGGLWVDCGWTVGGLMPVGNGMVLLARSLMSKDHQASIVV